jgi:phosphate transport system substrate-binding protein
MKNLFAFIFILLVSCSSNNNGNQQIQKDSPNDGTIYMSVDESFKPVIDEQMKIYKSSFPNSNIIVSYKSEVDCFKDLIQDSTRLIIVSRGLRKNV